MQRVPVLSPSGEPLMPTKASRARRWLKEGKAKVVHNDLGIFCIQLLIPPSDTKAQPIVVGIDPGKKFTGIGVQSARATLFMAHLILPFVNVTKKMTARKILRRARRGRRINRRIAFKLRCHKQKRFNNRRQSKLPPSIHANKCLEMRVFRELLRLYPITDVVLEIVKARGNKGFSPVMVGQNYFLEWLKFFECWAWNIKVHCLEGWETSITRQHLKLEKNKEDKSAQTPETHAHDGIALAASRFVQYQSFQTINTHGHEWVGKVQITSAPFRVIARPNIYRRQLHFENPVSGTRKRKGGTITPFGFRSGDMVKATKAGKTYIGWVGGYTQTEKTSKVSVYDHNWYRIGQFTPTKVRLLKRNSGLCVAV